MEIPNIKIENNEVVRETLEVPILINGETQKVVMIKLPSGKRRDIMKRFVKANMSESGMKSDVTDIMGIQIAVLSEVIQEAPFNTDEKYLSTLSEDVIDYLYSKYQDWGKKKTTED